MIKSFILSSILSIMFFQNCFSAIIINDTSLGIGNLSPFTKKIQTNESNKKNSISFSPYVHGELKFKISENFSINPEINIGLPSNSDDKKHTKSYHLFLTSLGSNYYSLLFQLGVGLAFTRNMLTSKNWTIWAENNDYGPAFFIQKINE